MKTSIKITDSKDSLLIYDPETIRRKIYTIREIQVMVDSDLAEFYGVETRRLNEQVKRNINRFPDEFMFQLTKEEFSYLISQIAISNNTSLISQDVISKEKRGGRQKLPYVFTEQGIAMLSGILRSQTAIK